MSKTVGGTTSLAAWDRSGSLPLQIEDGSTYYIYGPGGLPLEQISGSTTLWYHHDQDGTTRAITNSSGNVKATYQTDPYGNVTACTGATVTVGGSNICTGTITVANPFIFQGQYRDNKSGLYYLRARYYDPATGQFLTVDSKVATTLSAYEYVGGNPLNEGDPSGLCGWAPWDWLSCLDNNSIQSQIQLAHPTGAQELQNLVNLAAILNMEDGGGEAIEGCELATDAGAPESINLADPEVGAFSRATNSFGQAAPEGEGYTYGAFNPATNPGVMAGARAVRTIDLSTGDTVAWQYETYDAAGNVRIIRPQWDTGPGPHFYYDANGNFTGMG